MNKIPPKTSAASVEEKQLVESEGGYFANGLLLLFFYGFLTPIGLALRLIGKDLLRLKPRTQQPTYWIARQQPGPQAEDFRHQY